MTVRALASAADVSPQGALDVVNDLAEAGIVSSTIAGRARMVELNREHLTVAAIVGLFEVRGTLVERLRDELSGWRSLAGAWLFGSVARGIGDRSSDVDLLLVAKTSTEDAGWVQSTGLLLGKVRGWTGNEAQLVEHSVATFSALVRRRNPLISAVRADGVELTKSTSTLWKVAR
jgi:predicted nucleotidyltransferase